VRIWQIGFLIVKVAVRLRFVIVGLDGIAIIYNSRPNLRKFRIIMDKSKIKPYFYFWLRGFGGILCKSSGILKTSRLVVIVLFN